MTQEEKKGLAVIMIILGISTLLAIALLVGKIHKQQNRANQACTLEAKVCPDGSTVGRTGPRCSFAECPSENEKREKKTDDASGAKYSYRTLEEINYVSLQGTPTIEVEEEVLECTKAEKEIDLDGELYCKTETAEGAAGSTYKTFTYRKMVGEKTVTTTFTTRTPQCANYDETKREECVKEQSQFSPDSYAEDLLTSVTLPTSNEDRISIRDLYFIMSIQDEVKAEIGQPIEGFEKEQFIQVYPGLVDADFKNVEEVGDTNPSGQATSADDAITEQGMKTLLANLSIRLNIPVKTQKDIDAILDAISQK